MSIRKRQEGSIRRDDAREWRRVLTEVRKPERKGGLEEGHRDVLAVRPTWRCAPPGAGQSPRMGPASSKTIDACFATHWLKGSVLRNGDV